MGRKIFETDAHELALEYASLDEGRDVLITPFEDGSFKVELTSDIAVLVSEEGSCKYK
jgi:hypothetical protein